MKNIVLTGFMASGKTTVGRVISEITGMAFADTDKMIEEKAGMTVNEIFERYGEEYFRNLESDIAKSCDALENTVISCGGGLVLRENNIKALQKNGVVFNLNPTHEVIKHRLSKAASTRPLLKNQDLCEVIERFEKRKPFYDVCDYKIEIVMDKTPDEIAGEIIEIYKNV